MSFGKSIVPDGDGSNDFGDDFFMLPSQRKKMMNQQNSSGASKKVKKRQSKQPKKTIDQILNEDDDSLFNEAFQIDSDNVSPNLTQKEKPKKSSPTKNTFSIETSSRNVIDKIETSLKEYISNVINSVRQKFIDELKLMINNSINEQSMIDSFLLNLPAEIEDTVEKEINTANEDFNNKMNSITSTISSFFNTVESIIPIPSSKLPQVSIEKLADDVYNTKTYLEDKFITPIRDFQNLNQLLASAKSQDSINQENKRIQSPTMMVLVGLEGDMKRMDIEEQAYNYKKKIFEQRKNEWKEAQIDPKRNKLSDPEVLLTKLSELSRKIPQSKYGGAVYNLKTLSEKVHTHVTSTKQLRNQFEVELSFYASKVNTLRKRKNTKISRSKSKGDDVFLNEYANDIKKQLEVIQRNREFHERFFNDVS